MSSSKALARTLKIILEECDIEKAMTATGLTFTSDPHNTGTLWMSLWQIHVATGYSTEYVRQIVKSLYQKQALQRTKKGVTFFYRHSAKAQDILSKLEKEA